MDGFGVLRRPQWPPIMVGAGHWAVLPPGPQSSTHFLSSPNQLFLFLLEFKGRPHSYPAASNTHWLAPQITKVAFLHFVFSLRWCGILWSRASSFLSSISFWLIAATAAFPRFLSRVFQTDKTLEVPKTLQLSHVHCTLKRGCSISSSCGLTARVDSGCFLRKSGSEELR